MARLFIGGDRHGDFDFLREWCMMNNTTTDDVLILAGDSAIIFEGEKSKREQMRRKIVAECPITILAVRGNHDDRPQHRIPLGTMVRTYNDTVRGEVYVDDRYPNTLFAVDGEEYFICGKSILTIGGAYSVDKEYRQMMHWTWYEDEMLSDMERYSILTAVAGGEVDIVVTHTCPLSLEPTWMFMSGIDQSKVNKTMEIFLEKVMQVLTYDHWYFGHFHSDFDYSDGKHTMLFHDIRLIAEE